MLYSRYKQFFGILLLACSGMSLADDAVQEKNFSQPLTNVKTSSQSNEEAAKRPVTNYKISKSFYKIPSLKMVDKAGVDVDLGELLDYGGPVMVQFIFATCSTICPILSACLASAQPELEVLANGKYRLVSISIDPEQDTPERLTEYANRFNAGQNWYFLTGKRENVATLLKAFDATYKGNNKMYHQSLTFMRPSKDADWTRIEGMLGRNDFLTEYKKMMGLPNQIKN